MRIHPFLPWLLAIVASAASAACVEPQEPPADAAVAGEAVYAQYCALCHGENGEGYAADHANALANQDFLRSASDAFLLTAIEYGRPGTPMAAYGQAKGGPLSDMQVAALIQHLRQWQSGPSVTLSQAATRGDPTAGETLFSEHCASCHGERGAGGLTALSLNNPMFLASATDGYIQHAIANGRSGTPMPAFADPLSPTQRNDITAAIRSWARTIDTEPAGEVPPSFDQIVIHPDGPAPDFPALREGRYLPAEAVKDAYLAGARMVLLDARATSDWLRGHIPGALPVPYYSSSDIDDALPKDDTWILTYCACPHAASGKVMDALRERGFAKTAVIDEGILVWMERGYPITHGSEP